MTKQELKLKKALEATGAFGIITKIELYKNVVLAYDPDQDERLKEVIDRIMEHFRKNLLVAHECDGTLTLIWKNQVPDIFKEGSIATTYPDGSLDHWNIGFSITSQSIEQEAKQKRLMDFNLFLN